MLRQGRCLSVEMSIPDGKRMLKVVHVVVSLETGGAERLVVNLANVQNSRNVPSVSIVCLDEPGCLVAELNGCKVECLHADRSRFPWDFSAVRKLREVISAKRQVENTRPDGRGDSGFRFQVSDLSPVILHAHNMAAWQYAVLASIGTNAKVVYTQHGINVHNQGFKNKLRSVFLSWFTQNIVAVSANTADAIVKYQGIPRYRIKVVRNGVDAGKFVEIQPQTCPAVVSERRRIDADERRLKERIGISSGSFVIGSVGRLDYVKGYDVLISAFAGLVKDAKRQAQSDDQPVSVSPVLLLVGDGQERTKLEAQAVDLGVNKQVVFAGYQGDVRKYLQAMDVFVLPSRSEGISISLLEACVSGLPVVVTDAGGNCEVVEDGVTGIIVPSGDEHALGEGIGKLLSDAGLRQRTGETAQKRVCEHFSIEKTFEEYEGIYSTALACL